MYPHRDSHAPQIEPIIKSVREDRFRRSQLSGLGDPFRFRALREGLTEVEEADILFELICPHVPSCCLDELVRQALL